MSEKYRLRVFWRYMKKPMWRHWKFWDDCTPEEQRRANLRTLWPHEVVLEFEKRGLWKQHETHLSPYNYEVFFSGSRGDHVHIYGFDDLARMPVEMRNNARKFFILRFKGADPCKASENTLISIEGKPHHKTNELKVSILKHDTGKPNKLPQEIMEKARELCSRVHIPGVPVDSEWIKTDPVLKYALSHTIRGEIGRHSVLFKNLAIGLVQSGLSDAQIEPYAHRIVSNCKDPPQTLPAFMGWVKGARVGQYKEYNRRELINWFREHLEVLA